MPANHSITKVLFPKSRKQSTDNFYSTLYNNLENNQLTNDRWKQMEMGQYKHSVSITEAINVSNKPKQANSENCGPRRSNKYDLKLLGQRSR